MRLRGVSPLPTRSILLVPVPLQLMNSEAIGLFINGRTLDIVLDVAGWKVRRTLTILPRPSVAVVRTRLPDGGGRYCLAYPFHIYVQYSMYILGRCSAPAVPACGPSSFSHPKPNAQLLWNAAPLTHPVRYTYYGMLYARIYASPTTNATCTPCWPDWS